MTAPDPARWRRVRALFDEAVGLPAAERDAFLTRACAGEADLRAEVDALVAADAALAGPPTGGPAGPGAARTLDGSADRFAFLLELGEDLDHGGRPGVDHLGGYRLLRRLGEGGMGIVYEAEQENPRRRVALKVVRGGPHVDEMRLRLFRREAQALARLRHPGIAAIHEAGSTEDGQHWIAMELAGGTPLDRGWTAAPGTAGPGREEIQRRLELLLEVCDAVAYAHQRGVIHRDLKPSNILVRQASGHAGDGGDVEDAEGGRATPRVKILDFGLARITPTDLDASVVRTESLALHGTLPYMSPEQARGVAEEVDTRADLYAIGVLLYLAITGTLPHDLERMSLPRALQTILDHPVDPPRERNRAVPSDLETIVLKALEKDPARRYASVAALGEDLRRFQAGLPVLARPQSALYQLRKLAGRHRTAVFLGSGLLAAVVLGTAGTTIGLLQARRSAAEARAEAETAAQVSRFLEDLFSVSDPGEARGNTITARELLDQGAARIEEGLRDQPIVQARLLGTIGEVYRKLGLYREARGPLERSVALRRATLGGRHPDLARSVYGLAGLLRRLGDFEGARRRYEEALAIREAAYGPDHPEVAVSLTGLANLMLELAEYAPARPLYERAIAIVERTAGPDDPRLGAHLFNLALLLQRTGDTSGALAVHQRLLALHEKSLGPDHPEVAADLTSLSYTYRTLGDTARARESLERALRIQEKTLGPGHTDLAETWGALGSYHLEREAWAQALRALEPAQRIMRAALGDSHPSVAMIETNRSLALRMTGRVEEAVELGERALRSIEAAAGPDHRYTAITLDRLAGHYAAAGDLGRARASYERALRVRLEVEGASSALTAETGWALAEVLERAGDRAAAFALFAQASRGRMAAETGPDVVWLRRFSGHVSRLRAAGEADSAAALEAAVDGWKRRAANRGPGSTAAVPGPGSSAASR